MSTAMKNKAIYGIVQRGEGKKGFWTRIGIAFVNRDGSLNLRFDYLPTDPGMTIQVRDERRDDQPEAQA
jgi:hypothetical protein